MHNCLGATVSERSTLPCHRVFNAPTKRTTRHGEDSKSMGIYTSPESKSASDECLAPHKGRSRITHQFIGGHEQKPASPGRDDRSWRLHSIGESLSSLRDYRIRIRCTYHSKWWAILDCPSRGTEKCRGRCATVSGILECHFNSLSQILRHSRGGGNDEVIPHQAAVPGVRHSR